MAPLNTYVSLCKNSFFESIIEETAEDENFENETLEDQQIEQTSINNQKTPTGRFLGEILEVIRRYRVRRRLFADEDNNEENNN